MTQGKDKCQDCLLYTDISALITDAKVYPCLCGRVIVASTRGVRVRFDAVGEICRHSSKYAPRMRN